MAEPAVRQGACLGCDAPLVQTERSPGIWRPILCITCFAEQAAVSPFLAKLPITQRAMAAVQFTLASVGVSITPGQAQAAIRAACLAEVDALGKPLPAPATYLQPGPIPVPCPICVRGGGGPPIVLEVEGGADVRVFEVPADAREPGDVTGFCRHGGHARTVRVLRRAS